MTNRHIKMQDELMQALALLPLPKDSLVKEAIKSYVNNSLIAWSRPMAEFYITDEDKMISIIKDLYKLIDHGKEMRRRM